MDGAPVTHIPTIIPTCLQSGQMVQYTAPVRYTRIHTRQKTLICRICRRNREFDCPHVKRGSEMGEATADRRPYDHPWNRRRSSHCYGGKSLYNAPIVWFWLVAYRPVAGPGSSLFLFEGLQTVNAGDSSFASPFIGSSRTFRYLHCGDFRASPRHVLHSAVKGKVLHHVYLDTTYLDPKVWGAPMSILDMADLFFSVYLPSSTASHFRMC